MGIGGILFNVRGRINKRQFWQGIVVLVTAGIVYTIIESYLPLIPRVALSLIYFVAAIWASIGVYGKRLHDAGLSAWLFLLFVAGAWLLSFIITPMLTSAWGVDLAQQQADLEAAMNPPDLTAFMTVMDEYNRRLLIPNILSSIIISFAMAAIPGFLLKSDPFENVHGQPVGGAIEDDFE